MNKISTTLTQRVNFNYRKRPNKSKGVKYIYKNFKVYRKLVGLKTYFQRFVIHSKLA